MSSRLRPAGSGAPGPDCTPGAASRPRPLGSGARLRRDRSLRADAQRRYRAAAAEDDRPLGGAVIDEDQSTAIPTASRSPQGGGERAARAERQESLTPLTGEVRALYEGGVVPVRAVARIADVSLRTLYNYVHKYRWRRRRADQPRNPGKAERERKRRLARKADLPGAPRGLKARDPQGQARALQRCERAGALSGLALERALARRDAEADARTLAILVRALRELAQPKDAARTANRKRFTGRSARRRAPGPIALMPGAPPPAEPEPLTEQERHINEIAASFYARRARDGRW